MGECLYGDHLVPQNLTSCHLNCTQSWSSRVQTHRETLSSDKLNELYWYTCGGIVWRDISFVETYSNLKLSVHFCLQSLSWLLCMMLDSAQLYHWPDNIMFVKKYLTNKMEQVHFYLWRQESCALQYVRVVLIFCSNLQQKSRYMHFPKLLNYSVRNKVRWETFKSNCGQLWMPSFFTSK